MREDFWTLYFLGQPEKKKSQKKIMGYISLWVIQLLRLQMSCWILMGCNFTEPNPCISTRNACAFYIKTEEWSVNHQIIKFNSDIFRDYINSSFCLYNELFCFHFYFRGQELWNFDSCTKPMYKYKSSFISKIVKSNTIIILEYPVCQSLSDTYDYYQYW